MQVMGGSGDYFADADTVIVMDNYLPSDQTQRAHQIAAQHTASLAAAGVQPAAASGAASASDGVWFTPRVPVRVYNSSGADDLRAVKTHVRGLHHIQVSEAKPAAGSQMTDNATACTLSCMMPVPGDLFYLSQYCLSHCRLQYGDQDIQLSAAEQLVDKSQTRAIADTLKWLQNRVTQQPQQQQGKTLLQWLQELDQAINDQVSNQRCLSRSACMRSDFHPVGSSHSNDVEFQYLLLPKGQRPERVTRPLLLLRGLMCACRVLMCWRPTCHSATWPGPGGLKLQQQ